jgi:hypothetical protein
MGLAGMFPFLQPRASVETGKSFKTPLTDLIKQGANQACTLLSMQFMSKLLDIDVVLQCESAASAC